MKLLCCLSLAIAMVGCMKHSFITGSGATVGDKLVYDEWHHHWIYGLVGDTKVKLQEICPSGNALIKEYTSFVNGLIGWLVGALYYPTTVKIYCAEGGKSFDLDLEPDKVEAFAKSPEFIDFVRQVSPEAEQEALSAQEIALLRDRSPAK